MRTITTIQSGTAARNGVHAISVKKAIFQSNIDMFTQRLPDACQSLIGETSIRVFEKRCRADAIIHSGNTRDTDAAAHKALNSVIIPEIKKAIQHKAKCRRAPRSGVAVCAGRDIGKASRRLQTIYLRLPKSDFSFKPERPKIITDNSVDIVTKVITCFDRRRASATQIIIDIFHQHRATFGANVPCVVPRQCGRSHGCGGERGRNSQIPHKKPLSSMSLRTARTQYPLDCFGASRQIRHVLPKCRRNSAFPRGHRLNTLPVKRLHAISHLSDQTMVFERSNDRRKRGARLRIDGRSTRWQSNVPLPAPDHFLSGDRK